MVEKLIGGIPEREVVAFAEALNDMQMAQREMFGDLVNTAIVTNVKAADLKGQPVSIRGLARVIGLQPSTVRRRIADLVSQGWLSQDDGGVHYTDLGRKRGAPEARKALIKFAQVLNRLGWGDFRPPAS